MGNKRDFRVGDYVTLAGNTRLTGKITCMNGWRTGVKWSGSDEIRWYADAAYALIPMTGEDILDQIMKKYHGYGVDSI